MIRYFISVVFKSALADRTHGLFPTERGENALSKRWQRVIENPKPRPQIRALIEEGGKQKDAGLNFRSAY